VSLVICQIRVASSQLGLRDLTVMTAVGAVRVSATGLAGGVDMRGAVIVQRLPDRKKPQVVRQNGDGDEFATQSSHFDTRNKQNVYQPAR
jgi:hypothetical protein